MYIHLWLQYIPILPKAFTALWTDYIKIENGLSDIVTLVGQQTDLMKSAKVAGNMLSHIRVAGKISQTNYIWQVNIYIRHYPLADTPECPKRPLGDFQTDTDN